jgi:hypothetical protein
MAVSVGNPNVPTATNFLSKNPEADPDPANAASRPDLDSGSGTSSGSFNDLALVPTQFNATQLVVA